MKRSMFYAFVLIFACKAAAASADEVKRNTPADAIRRGCTVELTRDLQVDLGDPLSDPPFSVVLTWHCTDGQELPIDRYGINGSSPSVASLFFWNNKYIFVLVQWAIRASQAADYYGDYYKVYAYKYGYNAAGYPAIVPATAAMQYFPAGVDGADAHGKAVAYPFKDADAIRKKLRAVDFK